MSEKIAAIFVIIIFGIIYSCGSKQIVPAAESAVESDEIVLSEPTRAESVMKAILEVYSDQVEKIEFRNDDWAILLKDTWYYYADGRLLPENQLENAANYRSYQFYNYPVELPLWRARTPEEIERFKSWTTTRRQSTTVRSSYFLDDLWQASTRIETERQLVRMNIFGKPVRVHKSIQDKLAVIETQIKSAAETEQQVQTWINSLGMPAGYSWRNIADSQSRSFHSYGLAVDLLPSSLGGKQTYWLWTSQHREDWWNVSYNDRYHPPAAVIRIFEINGFVWGGKWPLFDTMHFEYRPEILKLNGIF